MTLSLFFFGRKRFPPKKTENHGLVQKVVNQISTLNNQLEQQILPGHYSVFQQKTIHQFLDGIFFCFAKKTWPFSCELIGFPLQGAMWSIPMPNSSKAAGCHCANAAYWGRGTNSWVESVEGPTWKPGWLSVNPSPKAKLGALGWKPKVVASSGIFFTH